MTIDRQMKKIIAGVILGGALAAFTTGCSSQIGTYKGDGGWMRVTQEGDAMGWENYNNHYAAVINEAKTSANKVSAYYKDRAKTTETRALRFGMPDWLKGLKKPAPQQPDYQGGS